MADDSVLAGLFFLSLFSLLVTVSTIPPFQLCGAANYNVWNLTSKIWRFKAERDDCLIPKSSHKPADSCEITMAFCQPISRSNSNSTCASSAVCESYPSLTDTYNLATYAANSSNPFNTTAAVVGKGFTTNYPSGDTYFKLDNTSCTLSTVMTFVCNTKAFWDIQESAEIINVPVNPSIQFVQEAETCTYSFKFDFAGACPATTPEKYVKLSPGSVLLMIFFVSVIVYFVMGCLVNVTRGKTRKELIPHSRFWAMLPVYIEDGCQLVFTCGRSRPNSIYDSI